MNCLQSADNSHEMLSHIFSENKMLSAPVLLGALKLNHVSFCFQCKISASDFWDRTKYPTEFYDLCIL